LRWGDASAVNKLEFWLWKIAPSRETKVLVAAACIVLAGAAAVPLVNRYGTVLSELVMLISLGIIGAVTSSAYADTHHPIAWAVSLVLHLTLFLIPAMGAWFALRQRWPLSCTVTISAWCAFCVATVVAVSRICHIVGLRILLVSSYIPSLLTL
jgi:hypothetical protein